MQYINYTNDLRIDYYDNDDDFKNKEMKVGPISNIIKAQFGEEKKSYHTR